MYISKAMPFRNGSSGNSNGRSSLKTGVINSPTTVWPIFLQDHVTSFRPINLTCLAWSYNNDILCINPKQTNDLLV